MWTALPAALTTHLLQPKQALPKPRPRRHRQAVPAPCCACTTANWCHRFATPPHAASSARCWPAEAKSVFAISTRVCRRGIGRSALLQILAIARLLLRFAPSSPSRSASCTPSREIVNTLLLTLPDGGKKTIAAVLVRPQAHIARAAVTTAAQAGCLLYLQLR